MFRYKVFLSHGSKDSHLLEKVEISLWREGMKPYAFEGSSVEFVGELWLG